jgi:hypothetical protein
MGLQGALRMSFQKFHESVRWLLIPRRNQYFHANIPGFEAFLEGSNDNQFVRNVILKFLTTKNLGKLPQIAQKARCVAEQLKYRIVANAGLSTLFLAKVTEPLKEEVNLAISDLFTESKGEERHPRRFVYYALYRTPKLRRTNDRPPNHRMALRSTPSDGRSPGRADGFSDFPGRAALS